MYVNINMCPSLAAVVHECVTDLDTFKKRGKKISVLWI
jgi:hypothetical protein